MFVKFDGNPCGKSKGDCVIRAIGIAENESWRRVYLQLCVEGYADCAWGDVDRIWNGYLERIGYTRSEPGENDGKTVAEFASRHQTGTYIIGTGTHAVAVVTGDIVDSWNSSNEPILYYYTKSGGEK